MAISPRGLGRPSAEETGVTIRAFPHALIDDRFVLSQDQPGLLLLAFNNRNGLPIGTLTAFIELPEAIELVGVGGNRQVARSGGRQGESLRYAIDATPTKNSIKAKGYNVFDALVLVVRTSAKPGAEFEGSYWLSNDDALSPKRTVAFGVIPRIEGNRPRRFETGVHFTANCIALRGAALEEYARFYAETGCNAAMIVPGAMSQHFRQMKVMRYHQPSWLVNGCMIGVSPRPEAVRFQYKDGSKAPNGVCPAVVYRREQPYFGEHVEGPLRKILVEDRDTDHFMCNWEPFMFDFKGCFCERCQSDFAEFAGVDRETLREAWPDTVMETYRDKWIEFRAWQNARLVQTIEETVNGLGRQIGRDAHFAPEVHIKSITRLWETSDSLRQYAAMAYADKIPLLNAWGPYPWQTVMQPYNYVRGYNLSTHCLTRDSVDYIRSRIPAGRRPRLIGFPHGLQGNLWTTEPESMAMDILTTFINEYDGQLVYAFPKGYDARYWRALAQANTAIARFEDFTLDGQSERAHSVRPLTPYPVPSPRFLKAPCGGIDAEKWADASMLQSWEYRLGSQRLIAVANYWQRGECFAQLALGDLQQTQRYILSEPLENRVFGAEDGTPARSAADLEQGVEIHVGAQRFAFLLVEPEPERPPRDPILRPSEVAAARDERLPAIRKACSAERRELGLADFRRILQKAGRLAQDGFVIERMGNGRLKRDTLRVRSRAHGLEIDVLGGGRVNSWTVSGTELVSEDPAGGLALDALWHPAKMLTGPMELVSRTTENGHARIVLRFASVGGLPGLELEKTFTIDGRAAAFTVASRLRNAGEGALEFSHRYHNMPVFLECRDGASGSARFDDSRGTAFTRSFERHMFLLAGAPRDNLLTNAFDMGRTTTLEADTVTFSAPWAPVPLRCRLPEKGLHSVVFWDSQAMPCATFEPIHSRHSLGPGEEWQTGMRWVAASR